MDSSRNNKKENFEISSFNWAICQIRPLDSWQQVEGESNEMGKAFFKLIFISLRTQRITITLCNMVEKDHLSTKVDILFDLDRFSRIFSTFSSNIKLSD